MFKFLLRTAVLSAAVSLAVKGVKKFGDLVSGWPIYVTVWKLEDGAVKLEGAELPASQMQTCLDLCREAGVRSAMVFFRRDGGLEFSPDLPAGLEQRLRNALIGCRV